VGQAVVENDLQIFDYDREGSFMSPLLPDTRWELALPLNAGGDVIGVLKIEGTDIDSFGYEEAKPIQRVADSVAEKLADTIAAGLRLGDNDLEENNIPTFPASAAIATGKLSRETIEINGNQLPLKLVDLIERGLCVEPTRRIGRKRIFRY